MSFEAGLRSRPVSFEAGLGVAEVGAFAAGHVVARAAVAPRREHGLRTETKVHTTH